ncbi:Hypothetical protein HVR_LOCUS1345 [uncultured virus]|nr:Hypothetical protein HVR_LOCUS1345 [uncultured virus]
MEQNFSHREEFSIISVKGCFFMKDLSEEASLTFAHTLLGNPQLNFNGIEKIIDTMSQNSPFDIKIPEGRMVRFEQEATFENFVGQFQLFCPKLLCVVDGTILRYYDKPGTLPTNIRFDYKQRRGPLTEYYFRDIETDTLYCVFGREAAKIFYSRIDEIDPNGIKDMIVDITKQNTSFNKFNTSAISHGESSSSVNLSSSTSQVYTPARSDSCPPLIPQQNSIQLGPRQPSIKNEVRNNQRQVQPNNLFKEPAKIQITNSSNTQTQQTSLNAQTQQTSSNTQTQQTSSNAQNQQTSLNAQNQQTSLNAQTQQTSIVKTSRVAPDNKLLLDNSSVNRSQAYDPAKLDPSRNFGSQQEIKRGPIIEHIVAKPRPNTSTRVVSNRGNSSQPPQIVIIDKGVRLTFPNPNYPIEVRTYQPQ